MKRVLLVPGYIYSALINDQEELPYFERQYLKQVDRYDDDLAATQKRKDLGRKIGYAFFSNLRRQLELVSEGVTFPPLSTLGKEGFQWKFIEGSLNADSIVYGVGIGTDMSFEEEVANTIGCTVHAFDPTPQAAEYSIPIARQNRKIQFHAIGVFSIDGVVQFYKPMEPGLGSLSATNLTYSDISIDAPVKRLRSIMGMLKHDRIDLLKIDIEGAEHGVIEDMLFSDVRVDQLCVEFDMPTPPWKVEATMRRLLLAGYRLVDIWGLNCLFVKEHMLAARGGA